jgi:CarD family transcriptional regulator
MAEFKIGDQLLHPVYGLGTLISIEKRGDDGKARDYYVIELASGQGSLATPVEKAEELGLRKPISKEDRDKLWKVFAGRPRNLPEDYRRRRSDIGERLRGGSFEEIGWVIRDLVSRQHQGVATTGDRRLLKRAKELLAVELAASEGIEKEEAMERVESVLGRRFSASEEQGS